MFHTQPLMSWAGVQVRLLKIFKNFNSLSRSLYHINNIVKFTVHYAQLVHDYGYKVLRSSINTMP